MIAIVESGGGAAAARGHAGRRRRPARRRPPRCGAGAARRRAARRRRRCRPRRCRRTSRPRRQGALPHASPTIRKLARELGVPLDEVKGSGPKGRITQEDVQALRQGGDGRQHADPGAGRRRRRRRRRGRRRRCPACCRGRRSTSPSSGRSRRKDLSRIKKISGPALHRNWVMIPHVTNHDDADITDLEAFRVATNKENEKSRRQGDDARVPDQGLRSPR